MILVLDDSEKEAVANLVRFSSAPENWYKADSTWSPGDRPEFTVGLTKGNVGSPDGPVVYLYKCVFTWTIIPPGALSDDEGRKNEKEAICRHLSVLYAKPNRFPHPSLLFTIATLFGYTGAKMVKDAALEQGDDWVSRLDDGWWEVLQEIPDAEVQTRKNQV